MAYSNTYPADGQKFRLAAADLRANFVALETALTNWADFTTGSTQTGRPKSGSARIYCQTTEPTVRLDGTHFTTAADAGTLWVHTDDTVGNTIYVLTSANGSGTNVWTPISTAIIATLLAAARTFAGIITFSVNPAFTKGVVANNTFLQGRNAADNANVDMIKIDGSNAPTLPDGTALATSAAPAADAKIANKKYVDDQLKTVGPMGTWATAIIGSATQAATDGFLVGYINENFTSGDYLQIKTDSANPPTVVRVKMSSTYLSENTWFMCPVKRSDYYLIELNGLTAGNVTAFWMPMGS